VVKEQLPKVSQVLDNLQETLKGVPKVQVEL